MNIYDDLHYAKWQNIHCFCYKQVPYEIRRWLSFPGSMTKKMRAISREGVHVNILKHGWGKLTPSEQDSLQSKQTTVVVREIEMLSGNEVWMVARTAMPPDSLLGKWRRLQRLGTKPLGDLLFKDPQLKRSPFEFQLLRQKNGLDIWARRSIFYLTTGPILLTEVFTPLMWERVLSHETNL